MTAEPVERRVAAGEGGATRGKIRGPGASGSDREGPPGSRAVTRGKSPQQRERLGSCSRSRGRARALPPAAGRILMTPSAHAALTSGRELRQNRPREASVSGPPWPGAEGGPCGLRPWPSPLTRSDPSPGPGVTWSDPQDKPSYHDREHFPPLQPRGSLRAPRGGADSPGSSAAAVGGGDSDVRSSV
ncbi:PREDICTED: myosin IC heavy chain-like [Galeopterus variegatus]|uniref:Myosin IC heavy chain-like n=1 Tax=Galeopterus variegatus TaxID=482537 RepID=A0ABM0SA66_GALVR|nr:PREDICTED: myosin IC heavy chain-like [Galeopterus variegatus]